MCSSSTGVSPQWPGEPAERGGGRLRWQRKQGRPRQPLQELEAPACRRAQVAFSENCALFTGTRSSRSCC